ncbi:MAG TPA: rRNA methyltransferase [Verrucomicrobia bacterium]|nr:MAG: hypothetical protein A2X46_13645 [Lentisphaerae bacterium GWF2_57_35]HBA82482.1 rRNA methyltransferase [Verrucomicrobiota bacterium]
MPALIKNLTTEQVHESLAHLGVKPRLARQIQAAVIKRGEWPPDGPEVSSRIMAKVRQEAAIPHLTLLDKVVSPADGFAKYLFRGEGDDVFEAVRIPLLHRPEDQKYVVCVSSQAGCAMGCAFCLTGQMGFRRNLAAWEMVDQACKIQADSAHPVRGIVFMGMGEPLLNYEAVLCAARILSEPCGMAISGKAITISTAGIVPGIRRFTAERRPYKLVISLTSADPVVRQELMPVEKTYPMNELMQAVREYHEFTRQRVTLAWTMIAGVNTREQDAKQLAELIQGLPIILDLIDVNDPSGRFKPPSREELDAFRDALRVHLGMPVIRRYSGGQDIYAACGMLAVRKPEAS